MKIKRTFTSQELINQQYGSLTYYIACELEEMGAPIRFNKLNVYLKPEDIEIYGELRDRIKQDGSHEFVFEKTNMSGVIKT